MSNYVAFFKLAGKSANFDIPACEDTQSDDSRGERRSKHSLHRQRSSTLIMSNEDMRTKIKDYLSLQLQIIPIGITNCGKTTFINNLLGNPGLLNTSEMRETSFLWKIVFSYNPTEFSIEVQTTNKHMKLVKNVKKYQNITELKKAIKDFALNGENDRDNPLISKVVVTLPIKFKSKITSEDSELVIIDMPGQEDLQ